MCLRPREHRTPPHTICPPKHAVPLATPERFVLAPATPDLVFPLALTVASASFRAWARLWWHAFLQGRQRTRTHPTTCTWPRADKPRTDGPMSRLSARYAQLIRMCRRRGCSREDARDLVQEAHLRWLDYERAAKVRDVDSLLRRILINLSITHYHRERMPPFTFESAETLDKGGRLVDPAPGPERTVAAEQELDEVVSLLSAVSPRTCQIFIAQRGGYSYEEIADAYAIKPRTVEKHVVSAGVILAEWMPGRLASP